MRFASSSTRRARPLLGTFVEISTPQPYSSRLDSIIDAAFDEIALVHDFMSFHAPQSDVSRINREAGRRAVTVHDWTIEVLTAALDLNVRSGGVFDISVAPHLQRLGRLPTHEHQSTPGRAHGTKGARLALDGNRVRLDSPSVMIDLGGIAKGYAVDRALTQLRRAGLTSAHVNAGGDQAAFGDVASDVFIRDPRQPARLIARIALRNCAIASSGGSVDPMVSDCPTDSAVIDPAIGEPCRAIAGASVCAPTCMLADGLTKVVMLMGQGSIGLVEHYGASAMLIPATGDICATTNWSGEEMGGETRAI